MVDQVEIESRISNVYYERPSHKIGNDTITLCYIELDNGFSVLGTSATVDADKFDEQKGREIAYENAFEQLWQLFGFLEVEQRYRKSG